MFYIVIGRLLQCKRAYIEKRMGNKLTTERLLIESDLRDNH